MADRSTYLRRPRLPEEGFRKEYLNLQHAWKSIARVSASVKSASEVRSYKNVFAQGWVLRDDDEARAVPSAWVTVGFGIYKFSYDPDLRVLHKGLPSEGIELLLLGHATDSKKRFYNSEQVANELFNLLSLSSGSWESFDEAVTWLGGRFLVIARIKTELRVHVDATASRSCYWANHPDVGIVLASHSGLVADLVGDHSSSDAKWVLGHPEYNNPTGVYLPGVVTANDCAKLVFANCVLMYDGDTVSHTRFFPSSRSQLNDAITVETATEEFLAEVRFQMDAILSNSRKSLLALTSGSDSRAIVTSTLDILLDSNVTAMTYHFFERNAEHTRVDLLGANRLAELSGLRHRILEIQPWDESSRFAKLYKRTFPVWARFAALSKTLYEQTGANETIIIGVGGEVGTAFYLERDFDSVTASVLAGKFTQTKFQFDPRLISEFEKYRNYTQLPSKTLRGFDPLDLFYWEHRLSSWASYWYSEIDFGPTVALPLNSRRIFTTMLSLPFEDRVKKSIYKLLESWARESKK